MIRHDEHRTILVLDRDARSRALVEGVLTLAGYRVVPDAATDDPAAPAPAEIPDLVLVDIATGVMEAVPR